MFTSSSLTWWLILRPVSLYACLHRHLYCGGCFSGMYLCVLTLSSLTRWIASGLYSCAFTSSFLTWWMLFIPVSLCVYVVIVFKSSVIILYVTVIPLVSCFKTLCRTHVNNRSQPPPPTPFSIGAMASFNKLFV